METYGALVSITSFVVPTSYSFDLDGLVLYQSIAAIPTTQLHDVDLSIQQEIILMLALMVISRGIANMPGVSFVALLATPGSVGIPLEGLVFIADVDRTLDMARTTLSMVDNALAVLVIAKWGYRSDRKKALVYEREVLGKLDRTTDQQLRIARGIHPAVCECLMRRSPYLTKPTPDSAIIRFSVILQVG